MSHGRIPPPRDFQQGGLDDAFMTGGLPDGQWSDDSERRSGGPDGFVHVVNEKTKKKNKHANNSINNNSSYNNGYNSNGNDFFNDYNNNIIDKRPVKVKHAGYILERERKTVKGKVVESKAWTRVTPLPYDEERLIQLSNLWQQRSKDPVHEIFPTLSAEQKTAVDGLINDEMSRETNKNAKWILHNLLREKKQVSGGLLSAPKLETRRIQCILKRTDRDPLKGSSNTTAKAAKAGKDGGRDSVKPVILDDMFLDNFMDQNTKQSGKSNKANKNNNGTKPQKRPPREQLPDPMDNFSNNNNGLGIREDDQFPRDYDQDHHQVRQQNHRQNSHQDQHHNNQGFGQQPDFGHQQPPPLPHGAIPVNPMMNVPPPPILPPSFQFDARRAAQEPHPFQPNDNVPMPAGFDSPFVPPGEWPHPQHHPRHQSLGMHARARSHERPMSARRATAGVDGQTVKELRSDMKELKSMFRNLDVRDDSSDSHYDGDSVFSHGRSPTRSLTPSSSPRSHFSEIRHRRSMDRGKSRYPRAKHRSAGYRDFDVDIEPGRSRRLIGNGERRPRQLPERSQTFDDYPRGAEPRIIRAPDPPQRVTRRSAEYDDGGYDYRNRDREREFDRDYDRRERDFLPGFGRQQSGFDVDYGQDRRQGSGRYYN